MLGVEQHPVVRQRTAKITRAVAVTSVGSGFLVGLT